ncbi:hypothetical protein [Accumulibacter sp.]|uniref:hypothetical protein n=1 Tax=Accumulibacter sp. TaxID=2053492 RepID=UPI0026021589|nr:hypothetical protein [Accumulibacter sp.]
MKLHSLLLPLLRKSLTVLAAAGLAFAAAAETKWDMPTPYPVNNFRFPDPGRECR